MRFWQRIIINALLFFSLSGFFPSAFYVQSIWTALIASTVLAFLNASIKPVLVFLSLPITFLTLGLFSVVINGAMLQLTAFLVGNAFQFSSFGMTMLIAVILSLANTIISDFFSTRV